MDRPRLEPDFRTEAVGMSRARVMALVGILVSAVVFALKLAAWWFTGSVALYSDALESLVNIVASAGVFIVLRVSDRPADSNHPYGHHKVEYFSAVIEGVLIVVAALLILQQAWNSYVTPQPFLSAHIGLFLIGLATVINAGFGAVLLDSGRRWRSPALTVDGQHVLADVATSIGVMIGVAATWLTGIAVLDPAIAALVALYVLWTGWGVVRSSVGGLMDEAVAPDVVGRIREIVSSHAVGALEAHDLKTRNAGRITFIEFHLVVPGAMSVVEAHAICDKVERALGDAIGHSQVSIHIEPEEKAKHQGVLVL